MSFMLNIERNKMTKFNIEKWITEQESIIDFHSFSEVEGVRLMPLDTAQINTAMELELEAFIVYVSNCGLVIHGERFCESGDNDLLETMWSLARLPHGFREAVADKVAEISGLDLPEDDDQEELALEDIEPNITEEELAAHTEEVSELGA